MNYKCLTIPNSGLAYLDDDFIAIRYKGKVMRIFNERLSELFQFFVKTMPTNRILRTSEDEFIVFDEGESLFYKRSKIVRKEAKYYFFYKRNIQAYFDLNDEQVLKIEVNSKITHFPNCLYNNYFFESCFVQIKDQKVTIDCYSYSTGELIWQRKIADFIGNRRLSNTLTILEHSDHFYIEFGGDLHKNVVVLNKFSGLNVTEFSESIGFLVHDNENIYIVKPSNVLYIIGSGTNTKDVWDVDEIITNAGFKSISDYRCAAESANLYFTQTLGALNSKIGILNTIDKKLEWSFVFDRKHGGIGSIRVNNGRVFVHTQDQALHIFEKVN